MANNYFKEFMEVESRIQRLVKAKDNLRIISERAGLEMDINNAIDLSAVIIEETLAELKELLDIIEEREPLVVCASEVK